VGQGPPLSFECTQASALKAKTGQAGVVAGYEAPRFSSPPQSAHAVPGGIVQPYSCPVRGQTASRRYPAGCGALPRRAKGLQALESN